MGKDGRKGWPSNKDLAYFQNSDRAAIASPLFGNFLCALTSFKTVMKLNGTEYESPGCLVQAASYVLFWEYT